jgi:hypothetical protein
MDAKGTISEREQAWPALPLAQWQDTCATLHMWTQIVGKVRLALSPHFNHWWEVPLYVNARGLTTSPIPWRSEIFEVQFDFINHTLDILTSWGRSELLPLVPRTVADFYQLFMDKLHSLGIEVKIWPVPVEIPNPIRFDQDRIHRSILARPGDRGHDIERVPRRLYRQRQPGAFFLGQLRPGRVALLRSPRPAASWRRPHYSGGLFP